MNDIFEKIRLEDKQNLRKQKILGCFLKIISLGIINNNDKIKYYKEKLNESEELCERKKRLEHIAIECDKHEESIKISGVRVSKYSFADLSVLGAENYPENWAQLRQTILERDNFQCQNTDGYCNGPLQIHHIIELSKGGTNHPSNLTTLCKYHHYLKHKHLTGMK